ncbi:hypothetical protein ENH_00033430 [Eimeria necatrix]|uniref:Uncharacterized protein n=1 Tax=Eimeria necatrix TaxID=51315 RepID=U6MGF6_9EIME|nr:hypothetical protein ENH_00033430 [Eimeria necatrix]CDJ63096.1 hypothetical protein ENH_00033430 [Eimeria necatrix]
MRCTALLYQTDAAIHTAQSHHALPDKKREQTRRSSDTVSFDGETTSHCATGSPGPDPNLSFRPYMLAFQYPSLPERLNPDARPNEERQQLLRTDATLVLHVDTGDNCADAALGPDRDEPRPFLSVVAACVAASAHINIRIVPLLFLCKSTTHSLKKGISKLCACADTRRFHEDARSDVGTGASGAIASYRVEYASLPSSRRHSTAQNHCPRSGKTHEWALHLLGTRLFHGATRAHEVTGTSLPSSVLTRQPYQNAL